MLSPARIGAAQPGDPADAGGDMGRIEIHPLLHRHRALPGRFEPGDEGRHRAGAPSQGAAGRIAGVRGLIGQQLRQRRAVRCLVQALQDALAGLR